MHHHSLCISIVQQVVVQLHRTSGHVAQELVAPADLTAVGAIVADTQVGIHAFVAFGLALEQLGLELFGVVPPLRGRNRNGVLAIRALDVVGRVAEINLITGRRSRRVVHRKDDFRILAVIAVKNLGIVRQELG